MACVFSGEYHDKIWGTPVKDSAALFAQLSLVTQQCGVSWRIVWNKREHYKNAFCNWDMRRVASMGDADLDRLCDKEGPWAGKLIQNRGKLGAIIHNARACVALDSEPGGLSSFLWSFVDGREETVNASDCSSPEYERLFGVTSAYSDALAMALKKEHGFKFVGSVTIQAFLLQNGLLNGHAPTCERNPRSQRSTPSGRGAAKRRGCDLEAPASKGARSNPRAQRSIASEMPADKDVWL